MKRNEEIVPVCYTFKSEIGANTRLDSASATVILAPAAGQRSPLIGCSPMEVADPVCTMKMNFHT